MKKFDSIRYIIVACAAFFACLTPVNALDTTVKVMVRQIQVDSEGNPTGATIDKYFDSIDLLEGDQIKEGAFTALIEIGDYGSIFYLYVESLDTGELLELATKYVSPYMAGAEIKITSEDDFSPVRTRADETFTVEVTATNEIWDNVLGTGITPDISWDPYKVKVSSSYTITDDSDTIIGTSDQTVAAYINGGSPDTDTFKEVDRLTVIPSPGRGKEVFTMEGASAGVDRYQPIDQESINIWPTAQGKFEGVSQGDSFTKSMPNVTAKVWDLYPESTTYVEIYKLTNEVYTLYVKPVVANQLVYGETEYLPHGTEDLPDQILLTNWDSEIQHNGTYALKIFTVTPFHNGDPELIVEVIGLIVDRKVVVKGSIINSESD